MALALVFCNYEMETLVVDANSTEDLDSLGFGKEGWSVKSKSGVGYLRRVVLLSRTADEGVVEMKKMNYFCFGPS